MRETLDDAMNDYADRVTCGLALLPTALKREIARTSQAYLRTVGTALFDVQLSCKEPVDYIRGLKFGKALGTFSTGCQLGLISPHQYDVLLKLLDDLKAG